MSDKTPSDALTEWFRRVGANMGRYDYESGVKAIHDLTESNRRLANQIVGYGDRMQQTIAGIVKDAKVEALREAADHVQEIDGRQDQAARDWLRTRADNLEKP